MTTLNEKVWRCECGSEAVGVSFYSWPDAGHDWFIEIYKLGGIGHWRWRLRNAVNMLLGRDVYIETVALDPPKVRELVSFLQAQIVAAEDHDATEERKE